MALLLLLLALHGDHPPIDETAQEWMECAAAYKKCLAEKP